METSLFTSEPCDIFFDQEIGCIILDWKGYATSAQFREIHEKMLEAIGHTNARLLLGNALHLVQIGAQDREWIVNAFRPRLVSAGIVADAVVRSTNYFGQVAIDSILKGNKERTLVRYFDTRAQAKEWLRTLATPDKARPV